MKKSRRFVDLGDSPPRMTSPQSKKKWYPSMSIRKRIPGIEKVGQKKTAKVKLRVVSMRDDGNGQEYGIELTDISMGE